VGEENGNGGRETRGAGIRNAFTVISGAWPIFAGAVLALLAYVEVRGDQKISAAREGLVNQIAAQYQTRAELDARRAETDRRLDDAAANDRVLAERLSRIEATLQQLQVSVEAIRQRQEDEGRASRSR
jgi:hypothetical protein